MNCDEAARELLVKLLRDLRKDPDFVDFYQRTSAVRIAFQVSDDELRKESEMTT